MTTHDQLSTRRSTLVAVAVALIALATLIAAAQADATTGGVSIAVDDGRLEIIGTNDDNQVTVRSAAPDASEAASFTIRIENGRGELIHEKAADAVTGNVTVDLRGGDDTLVIESGVPGQPVSFPRDLIIADASGDDRMTIVGADIGGDVVLLPGGGDDPIEIRDTHVGGNLTHDDNGGADGFASTRLMVDGDLRTTSGSGDDTVSLTFTTARLLHVDTGDGEDRIRAAATSVETLSLSAGAGADFVLLEVSARSVRRPSTTTAVSDDVELIDIDGELQPVAGA